MKNRIAATVLASALAVASIVGLTACKGLSVPKGDEVTAEEWKTAFAKTQEVTNYTMEVSLEVDSSVKGTVYSDESKSQVDAKADMTISSRTTTLYNREANQAYSENSYSSKVSATEGEEEENYKSDTTSKTYYDLSETRNSLTYYWKATYSSKESSSSDSRGEEKSDEENFWYASETATFASNSITTMFSETTFYETNDETSAQAKSIIDLYEKFMFDGGTYTATLYRKVDVYEGIKQLIECNVSVSFNKAESCVIGFGIKTEGEGNVTETDEYNLDYTYKGESVYAITKIKETDVTEKSNKDITEAIDKAKERKANEG